MKTILESKYMVKDYYKEDDLLAFTQRIDELRAQYLKLKEEFVLHKYQQTKAKEFAQHGFMRRTSILWRCVEKVFILIPPDLSKIPQKESVDDATIYLHAFYVNLFGACDNLAWVLVSEKQIKEANGAQIDKMKVGLRQKNKTVRLNLSQELLTKLNQFENWFDHVANFRDSLAHRIPLYVPPFSLTPENEPKYQELGEKAWKALEEHDFDKSDQLKLEQEQLRFFRPWFTHSYAEKAPIAIIHSQLIADFATIVDLGEAVLLEMSDISN